MDPVTFVPPPIPRPNSLTPPPALLAAALAGLLGGSACDPRDPAGPEGKELSSVVDPDMTREKFEAACDDSGGKLELHAHCGGENSCKGFSYDTDTHVFTEHTCKGMNTCAGYSCVVPDESA